MVDDTVCGQRVPARFAAVSVFHTLAVAPSSYVVRHGSRAARGNHLRAAWLISGGGMTVRALEEEASNSPSQIPLDEEQKPFFHDFPRFPRILGF